MLKMHDKQLIRRTCTQHNDHGLLRCRFKALLMGDRKRVCIKKNSESQPKQRRMNSKVTQKHSVVVKT